jgi:sugar lactone lactonase YvrE
MSGERCVYSHLENLDLLGASLRRTFYLLAFSLLWFPFACTRNISVVPTIPMAATPSPTMTPTNTPTVPANTPTNTVTATPSNTATSTRTQTCSFTPTETVTNTPTVPVSTPTDTATETFSDTPTSTYTDTCSFTPTETVTNTPAIPVSTPTDTATETFSDTPTSTYTDTCSFTPTDTVATTPTHTPTSSVPACNNGGAVTTLAGSGAWGSANGPGNVASFAFPEGVAVDASGNVYAADNDTGKIREITSGGTVTTLASFSHPAGIAVDSSGNVYVSDNQMIREISSGGVVSTLAGQAGVTGSIDGTGTGALFSSPQGIAVDSAGNLYVGDAGNHTIRIIAPGGVVSTLAGQAGVTGATNGPATEALFSSPHGVAVDSSGNVYIADAGNHIIREITPGGDVSTLAGQAGVTGAANGPATEASFRFPWGVAVDASGNVYVGDEGNNMIREITPGGMVSTLAGSGSMGSANGTGTSASFFAPFGVAVDDSCVVYVGDAGNNLIRKIQ